MAYCAICVWSHDPGMACLDGWGQALKDIGIDAPYRPPHAGFRRIAKLADRWILKVLLWALVIIALMMILSALVWKMY